VSFASTVLPQPRFPVTAGVNAQELERFLALRGEVTPALGVFSDRTLPKMSDRVSNAQTRQRAMRLLAEGDSLFQAQNFNSALQRYKLAASLAPDVEEAFWRQGHAYVATKNFDRATTAFKRAIALSENLGRGGFRLDDLYSGASMTKATHLENLAELALANSGDSDAYFLIGLFLNYDGQAERAARFFDRASDLAGISGGHIEVFLNRAAPAFAVRPDAPPVPPPPPAPAVFISAGTEI
jgi:tetratricopeptide (TPR) repeat protein